MARKAMIEVVGGVYRAPPTGISVIVLGGSVAGLQAALECWRKGMDVQLCEKPDKVSPHG